MVTRRHAKATHRRAGPGDGLRALWEVVTAQAPGVVLSRPHTLGPQMRRLRMECEVIDALRELEPHLPGSAGSGAGRPTSSAAVSVASSPAPLQDNSSGANGCNSPFRRERTDMAPRATSPERPWSRLSASSSKLLLR